MNITPEIRQAIDRSGGAPLRLDDPLSRETYILLKASDFERIERLLAPLIGKRDDWQWANAYTAADEAFREGWEAPGMSEYDEYENAVERGQEPLSRNGSCPFSSMADLAARRAFAPKDKS